MYLVSKKGEKIFFQVFSEGREKDCFVVSKEDDELYAGTSFYMAWKSIMDVMGRSILLPKQLEKYLG